MDRLADPDSVYWHYRVLARLRTTEPMVTTGVFELLAPDDDRAFAYLRRGRDASLLIAATSPPSPIRSPCPSPGHPDCPARRSSSPPSPTPSSATTQCN